MRCQNSPDYTRWLCLLTAILFLLAGCSGAPVSAPAPKPEQEEIETLELIEDEAVPLAEAANKVLVPTRSGKVVHSNSRAEVDASNTAEGYIMVRYTGSSKKVKLQITRSGAKTYTYDLSTSGKAEVFPLTSGDGTYSIKIFENVGGNQYSQALSASATVKLRSELLPYLYPNQYVNFNANSATVKKSEELAVGVTSNLAMVEKIYNYVVGNISYDTQKAQTVKSGYLPVVDTILQSKKGICFDYAAVMATMLRAQGIPTRLEVGYVSNGAYHAWISTYIKDVGWVNNIIQFDGKTWKLMDPTFASSAKQSASIMQYIGNGSNYQTAYRY
jgi:Transglutaminase-like enzymes, putative cysteine proteases